jgi:haloacetate dehalogenase
MCRCAQFSTWPRVLFFELAPIMSIREIAATDQLFPGFQLLDVTTRRGAMRVRKGGNGPPLLLLHGYPQTHAMWHKVSARLQDRFTLICADLPGYGDSFKPVATSDHAAHSKRAMAADCVAMMEALGFSAWYLGAHDRGARVAHRMALDHPHHVLRTAMLDIAPTREMYAQTGDAFARAYWHWFFLIQPAPFPERMILADTDAYWRKKCGSGLAGMTPFSEEALAHYLRCFRDEAVIHGSCEDYRAAASIDIAHDDADDGKKIHAPLLVLWGKHGVIERCFDAMALWRQRATHVTGHSLPGGHYLAEELPDEVSAAFAAFFLSN